MNAVNNLHDAERTLLEVDAEGDKGPSTVAATPMQNSRGSCMSFRLIFVVFVPDGLPYSAWQVLEHMRIAQRHMLDYATQHLTNAPVSAPKTLRWPRDYWVRQQTPAKDDSWERSVQNILEDRNSFEALIDKATDDELVTPSGPRNRKTLLRLALQISDHNSYHIGQLVIIRRLLRSWKK